MSARDLENQVAAIVAAYWASRMGIEPGLRDRHDGQPGKLAIDFVFPEAKPEPQVLEVTRLTNSVGRMATAAMRRLCADLTEVSQAENLGAWEIWVDESVSLKDVRRKVLDAMRLGKSIPGGPLSPLNLKMSWQSGNHGA